jgi:hypothetical protein
MVARYVREADKAPLWVECGVSFAPHEGCDDGS